MNNFEKEATPLNLNIEDKHTLQSNGFKAPSSPKQPFFIGTNDIYIFYFQFHYFSFVFLQNEFFLGVAGGTASGKTTVCNMINTQLHDQRVVLITQVTNSL